MLQKVIKFRESEKKMKDINTLNNTFPWLVFNLNKSFFAFNCENITTITILPRNITEPVLTPSYIRGLLDLRGEIIPLVDMRKLFGFPTATSEFDNFKQTKAAAIAAHQAWVEELIRCAEENDKFTKETDPTKCDFGKWLIKFESNSNVIASHLRKINEPHNKLHQEGQKVVELQKQPHSPERDRKIKECAENAAQIHAPSVVSILEKIEEDWLDAQKEMVIIFTFNDKKIGLIVDEVQSVERLEILNQEINTEMQAISHYFSSIARSTRSDNIIFLIDETELGVLFSEADFLNQEALANLTKADGVKA